MSTRLGNGLSIEALLRIVNKKWTILAVVAIGNCKRVRFNELRRELSGISPKTLIETIRELQDLGVVASEHFVQLPPRVEYFLTEEGTQFRESLLPLVRWMAGRCDGSCTKVVITAMKKMEK